MKTRKGLLMILLLAGKLSFAQVGIGTATPHASSALDVSSTSKGLLLPRMTTVQRNAIVTPATGLIVFDTTLNGFYGYDGSTWTQTVFSPQAWNLNGNAGTDPATQFVGTTDNSALSFRVNGNQAMSINSAGGVTLSGPDLSGPRLFAARPNLGTRIPAFFAEVSNDLGTAFPINYTTANIADGRIKGNYSFASSQTNARNGISIAGIAYDATLARIMFYAGGHPTSIDDTTLSRMYIYNSGNVSIGTSASGSKLTVGAGDVYLNTIGNGVIMKSPDGNCWKAQVSNAGVLSSISVTCP